MTDEIADRGRKIGSTTIRSIGDIARRQRLRDNGSEHLLPRSVLAELRADNQQLTRYVRASHSICETYNDVAATSLIEVWIDQTERRAWFLSEILNER